VFDLIRGHGSNASAVLCAFDLLEVNGEDIRREPIEDRKRHLAGLLRLAHEGIALNEHFSGDGAIIYKHACAAVNRRRSSSVAETSDSEI
jgi:bifunctional non-homologous end joining protein LigD